MADEPVKQPADSSAPLNPASGGQSSPFPKKRRRRRPRRKKPAFAAPLVPKAESAAETAGSLLEPVSLAQVQKEPESAPIPEPVSEPKTTSGLESVLEPTPAPAEIPPEPEPFHEPEPQLSPEPEPEPVPAPAPIPEPQPTYEEPKPEEGPSPFANALKPEEAQTAPKGWDQLKNAIKQDHEITKEKLAAGTAGIAAAGTAAAVVSAESKTEKSTSLKEEPKKEQIPRVTPEEEQERKEVFAIIVRYVLSGCAIIAILIGIFFLNLPQTVFNVAKNFFVGSQQSSEQQTPDQEVQVPNTNTQTEGAGVTSAILAGENKAKSKEEFEQGVETALVTGQDVPKLREPTSAVSTVFMIGFDEKEFGTNGTINAYMDVLIRLQNAFKTDIHEMLNKAPDREAALELHINELNSVYDEAKETIRLIKEKMDEIKVEFNQVTTLKDQLEKDFFNSMDKLEGNDSDEILNQFIEVSKRYTSLKAQYSALDKTNQLFTIAMKNMEVRIKDIEYNRDALIKGVKVVDIKGSDLDLIIQEGEL